MMIALKKLLKRIVYLNIIVAASTAVLSAGFCYFLEVSNWMMYGLLAFFSTFAVYNGQRLFKSRRRHDTPWLAWVNRNKYMLYFLVAAALATAISILLNIGFHSKEALIVLFGSGLISMFYVIPLGKKNLRELPYIKIHLIAISWVLVLVVFPMLNEAIHTSILLFGVAHYFYILGVTIPFDIRDLKYDNISQKTIPQLLGIPGSKVLAVLSLIVYAGIMLSIESVFWNNPLFFLGIVVQTLLILLINEKRSDIYSAGWIDGAIALIGLSYIF